MYRQTKPCRYGPQCHYLKQDRCYFYHPAEHKNSNRSTGFKSSSNNRMTWTSMINNFGSDSEDDDDIDTMSYSYLRIQNQAQIQRKCRQQIIRQRQLIKQRQRQRFRQRIEQSQRNFQIMIRQRLNLIRSDRTSLANLNKEKQQFPWFFQKNRIFNLAQSKSHELQRFNQCPICFEDFQEEIRLARQNDQSKKKSQVKEQAIDQSPNIWLFYKKEKQQQVRLIELYCGHIYHKDCVQNWLKKNPKCAVCRKDFRDHQQYSKWDKDYKKRFNCTEQKKLQRSTSAILSNNTIGFVPRTVPRLAVSNTQQIERQRQQRMRLYHYFDQ